MTTKDNIFISFDDGRTMEMELESIYVIYEKDASGEVNCAICNKFFHNTEFKLGIDGVSSIIINDRSINTLVIRYVV